MIEFFQALMSEPFLQVAMLGGLMVSLSCGIVGSYVVVRRISYIAGGIAHCVLGGIGVTCYVKSVWELAWLEPIHGAIAAAVLAACVIGWVSLSAKQHEETIIGGMWAIGMAIGVLCVTITPGYSKDLMGYLFGNILLITKSDIMLIGVLDIIVIIVGLGFYRKLLAVCFDDNFTKCRGINVKFWYLTLLILTALTVVLLTTVVGIVMVIAMITLPVAIARIFSRQLWQMMLLGTILSMLFTAGGFALSYQPRWPTGATIILLTGSVYLICVFVTAVIKRGRK